MATFDDGQGNYFIGDCIFANHNPSFPLVNYLLADDLTDFSADLASICTSAGLETRNILPQSDIDTWLNFTSQVGSPLSKSLLHFGVDGDINDRYGFYLNWNGNNTGSGRPVTMFNNSGSTNTTNLLNESTNLLIGTEYPTNSIYELEGGFTSIAWQKSGINDTHSPVYVCGVANSTSLALYFRQQRFNLNGLAGYISCFLYAGQLLDINPNNSYYNANNTSKSILFTGGNNSINATTAVTELNGRHYIDDTAKYILSTEDAIYPIVCADSQEPTSKWVTDFGVFDDDDGLGNPLMGVANNLLLAQGNFTMGKPVKIQPTAYPDSGFNRWLPVGTFAGKTVLMRCYSSVVLV